MAQPTPEEDLDRYARLVRRALGVPTALVTLVEPGRQVFAGADGLPPLLDDARETPLSQSICQHVVADQAPVVLPDVRGVDRLADLAPSELDVVAYAGWPLVDHLGRTVGSLCAIDDQPRRWTSDDLEALADIAAACSAELAERFRRTTAVADLQESERHGERSRVLLVLSEALSSTRALGDIAVAVRRVTTAELGCAWSALWLLTDLADLDRTEIAGRSLHWALDPGSPYPPGAEHAVVPVDHDSAPGWALSHLEAVFLGSRAEQDAAYPVVAAEPLVGGARVFLPLVLGERPLGVLALVWPDAHAFDDEDRVTMAALSSYTAQAVHRAALLEERVSTSVTLQRAMLTDLPSVAGLEIAARYLPAARREQVGGDWYDAIHLASGTTMLAVGDVVGHDIVAAAVMGQLRSMLRTIVWTHEESPSDSLCRLDSMATGVGLATIASVLLVHVEPHGDRWRLTWSSAGHPPGLLVDTGGTVVDLATPDGVNDGLLGVDVDTPRHDHVVDVEAGAVLLVFTDGLVERRGEPLDVGLDRLGTYLATHPGPVEGLLDGVLRSQLEGPPDDDVAVLGVRFSAVPDAARGPGPGSA